MPLLRLILGVRISKLFPQTCCPDQRYSLFSSVLWKTLENSLKIRDCLHPYHLIENESLKKSWSHLYSTGDGCVLGRCAVSYVKSSQTFHRCLLPPSSGRSSPFSLMMETESITETSIKFYQITRRNNPQCRHLYACRHLNLKSHFTVQCQLFVYCRLYRSVICDFNHRLYLDFSFILRCRSIWCG
jgi:hypothetical protein